MSTVLINGHAQETFSASALVRVTSTSHQPMNVKLEIRHLKLLSAVAQQQTVTGAARQLHLTQSALSHQLRDAEEKLGTRLFLRLSKRMVLTPAGETLLTSAQRVLRELQHAEESVNNLNGCATGAIRLSTECYTCYHWLPPVMKEFQKKFPGVDVRIELEATNKTVEALLEGRLDLGILCSVPREDKLQLHRLFDDEMLLVMPPRHRLAKKKFVDPRDLAEETIIIYPPKEESTLLQRFLLPEGIEPKGILQVPLTDAIIELVRGGMGVGFLAQWSLEPHIRAGRVVARRVTPLGFRRQWSAATLRGQQPPAYVEQFISLLANRSVTKVRAAAKS